ncbi:hypothetical protein [Abyssalbus ytuae]|uniref:Haem-binding uptake Tiki superfamily ChaN domain-containing protein n=1 Tax=Abyssalbus ytuae TaxID=2926907 RepID=A0A9E6ZQ22_9FLAO|nr:hypothetical protein [Abyssalbus ytuae]UOB18480.1 hypothetical protein MQE35_04110 [Abyssalbus ytuae]
MKNKLFILSFLCVSAFLSAQDNLSKAQQLEQIGLYKLPDPEDLKNLILKENQMEVSAISTSDISPDFSNIDDLQWLKKPARQNKVIMLGENHYHNYIHNLRHRMFFALNQFDYYPLIVLEMQYSLTAYVNYYLSIKNEQKAKQFFDDELSHMVTSQEDYNLFLYIRKWNTLHPEKPLKAGCSDLEHDYKTTIERIILPYLNMVEKDTDTHLENLMQRELGSLIAVYKKRLKKAAKKNLTGKYPFITPTYIKTVIDNLESLHKAYYYDFNTYRQIAIVRNLTGREFLGKYWKGKKMFLHGGNYHLTSQVKYPDQKNFLREGSYLNFEYPETKGKTYAVQVTGLARSLEDMANISLDSCIHVGRAYRQTTDKFQTAYQKNLILPDDNYIEWKIGSIDSLIVKKAFTNNTTGVIIEKTHWPLMLQDMKEENMNEYNYLKYRKDQEMRYDKIIYFIKSPLIRARIKE